MHIKLFESWLMTYRDDMYPVPDKKDNWRIAERKVTPETFSFLKEMEKKDAKYISIFSWHPDIINAQYSTKDWNNHGTNYNTRIRLNSSIIVKFNGKVENGFRIIKDALKNIPQIKTLGGNGDTENNDSVYQMQISFLTSDVGTHEEAKTIKEKTLTAGAFRYDVKGWEFIPLEEFDVIPKMYEIRLSHIELLKSIFQNVTEVFDEFKNLNPTLKPGFSIEPDGISMKIYIDEEKDGLYSYKIAYNNKHVSVDNLTEMLLNTKLFSEPLAIELGKNPENYKEIFHKFRGSISTKNFGI